MSSEQPRQHRKPHSSIVTDGVERAAARGMLRAVGMGDDDWRKPQIGVASSWNEITPCNLSLARLAKAAKQGVHAADGFPLEFGTISVSDGISMGHSGMHYSLVSREVITDSVETVFRAEQLDGGVLLAGCDKSLPGMLMAAARLDVAAVFLYAGSTLPGKLGDRIVTIIDAFEAVGACLAGHMTRDEVDAVERAICPGEGACGGMYTANTMASAAEALGMSLPGSAAPPAPDRRSRRLRTAFEARPRSRWSTPASRLPTHPHQGGVRERHHRRHGARRIDQRRPAPARHRTRGEGRRSPWTTSTGSARVAHRTCADVKPFGEYVMTDIDRIGGIPVVMKALLAAGLLHGDALTVTGRRRSPRTSTRSRRRTRTDQDHHSMSEPIHRTGGLDDPARIAGARRRCGQERRLRRRRLRGHREGLRPRAAGDGRILAAGELKSGDVVVIRWEGP